MNNYIVRCLALLLFVGLSACKSDVSISELGEKSLILDEEGAIADVVPISEEEIAEEEIIEEIVETGEIPPIVDEDGNNDGVPPIVEEEPPVEEEIPPVVEEEPPVEEENPPIVVEEEPPAEEEDPSEDCSQRKSFVLKKLDGSDEVLGDIASYKGPLPAALNYNYYSWSAHPIIGPQPEEYEGHFFFYEGEDGLSFNFFYNIDAAGSPNNQVKLDVIVEGNNSQDQVMLSDDGHEVKRSEQEGASKYEARLHYWYNTDGGVIGPFKGESFKIKVRMYNVGDNKEVAFHSADGRMIVLENQSSSPEIYSEFEISYNGMISDCDDGLSSSQNACLKEVYESADGIAEASNWQSVIREMKADRKAQIVELASQQKASKKELVAAQRADFKSLRESLKSERKALHADHKKILRSKIKEMRAEFKASLKGKSKEERKALRDEFRAQKRALHSEYASIRKALKKEHKSKLNALRAEHKAERKEFCKNFKSERQSLARSLAKKINDAKRDLMKRHSEAHGEFAAQAEMCMASE